VHWSVHRRRFVFVDPLDGAQAPADAALDWTILVTLLHVVFIWPFLFIAKWLGLLPWTIVIEREAKHGGFKQVGTERVRGWRKSNRRIQEIAQSAAAGTLEQSLGLPGPGGA
jgi:hypothetical protein